MKKYVIFPENYENHVASRQGAGAHIGPGYTGVVGFESASHSNNIPSHLVKPLNLTVLPSKSCSNSRRNSRKYPLSVGGSCDTSIHGGASHIIDQSSESPLVASGMSSGRLSTGSVPTSMLKSYKCFNKNEDNRFLKPHHEVSLLPNGDNDHGHGDDDHEISDKDYSLNRFELSKALKNLESVFEINEMHENNDVDVDVEDEAENNLKNELYGNELDFSTGSLYFDKSNGSKAMEDYCSDMPKYNDDQLHRAIKLVSRDNSVRYYPAAKGNNKLNKDDSVGKKQYMSMAEYNDMLQSSLSSSMSSVCQSRQSVSSVDKSYLCDVNDINDQCCIDDGCRQELFMCDYCNISFQAADEFIEHVQVCVGRLIFV